MAGFLDKQERIVDLVLTSEGKRLLTTGELNFTYWKAFDDEVDYSPIIMNSASLSSEALSSSIDERIEDTLVREATTGYRLHNSLGRDDTNVHRPLFTAPQGRSVVPRMVQVSGSDEIELFVDQRKIQEVLIRRSSRNAQTGNTVDKIGPIDRGFQRQVVSVASLDFDYRQGSYPEGSQPDGFLIKVLRSGSGGYVEVKERVDSRGDVVFSEDFILDIKK